MSAIHVSIDYEAIAANTRVLGDIAGDALVMAVVKADAYGHGLVKAAQAVRRGGAHYLGVAQPLEAIALRQGGDTGPVLTWLYGPDAPFEELLRHGIDVSVSSPQVLDKILVAARHTGLTARLHVCVDTGLGREGIPLIALAGFLEKVVAARTEGLVAVVGMWSHLAWADQPGHPTVDAQAHRFREALALASQLDIEIEFAHLANSACTLTRTDLHFDMVRPGIAIYGLPPVPDPQGRNFGLNPAMSVSSSLVLVKEVAAGHGVSYGHEYVTPYQTFLGLVSAGYADGVFRAAGGVAEVMINGRRHPVAGRICMDQFVVDLGPATDAIAGDEVVLIGPDGPTAREWAVAAQTIDYEIVCRFGGLRPKTAT